jgi:mRNA interferase RelE/StbE
MLTLRFAKPALKSLLRIPSGLARRMRAELGSIATDPTAYRGDDWKPLQGTEFWRLRVGDWRAICEFRDDELVLLVVKMAPRGDAYK